MRTCSIVVILGLLTLGCTPTPIQGTKVVEVASPERPAAQIKPPVHQFSDNYGSGLGCIPRGDTLTLRGTIVVRPFGKGSDGAVLRVNGDQEWILSYRAEGVLLGLDGERAEITGRACDKDGEAIYGDHFDLATLVELNRR